MTQPSQTELRVKLAEWAASEEIKRRQIVAEQNPPGTEGYKCDLSGLWILKSKRDGCYVGMNFATAEEAFTAFRAEWVREHDLTSLDAVAELEARLSADEGYLYEQELIRITEAVDEETNLLMTWRLITATALQRCLALAKTLNL